MDRAYVVKGDGGDRSSWSEGDVDRRELGGGGGGNGRF
jgi:hypothetical protein